MGICYKIIGMRKLLFICGPAGIGKSTFSKYYAKGHPKEHIEVVSSDEIRKSHYGSYANFPGKEAMGNIYTEMCEKAAELFEQNQDITIILDTTMLNDQRRLFFLDRLPVFDESICYLLKLHDYSMVYERNKTRPKEKWVPEETIKGMIDSYQDPAPEVAARFSKVVTVYVDNMKAV